MLAVNDGTTLMCRMQPDPLDLRQLEAFAAVMSAGSITSAARSIGRSQSAVTRLIQDLESVVGFKLLHRNGPRISPTEQGVLFLPEVEGLLQCLRRAGEAARAIGAAAPPPITIAASPALSIGLLPAALASLDPELLPGITHVSVVTSEKVLQDVVSRTADFGLGTLPFTDSDIQVHWTGQAPCVAVLRADDVLAGRRVLRLRDLRKRRVLASRLPRRIADILADAGIADAQIIETNAASVTIAMARAGLGLAIVDPVTAYGLPLDGVTIRPLDAAIPFVFGAFSPSGKPMSPILLALNEALLTHAAARLPGFRQRNYEAEGPAMPRPLASRGTRA